MRTWWETKAGPLQTTVVAVAALVGPSGCTLVDEETADAGAGAGDAGGSAAAGQGGGAAGGASGAPTNPLDADAIEAFVAAHNAARSGPLMPAPEPALPPVTWDPVLADVAYDYLSRCPSPDGVFTEHNPHATEDYAALGGSGWVGENIWGTSGDAYTAAEVVADWMSEAPDYDHASNTSSGVTGHYTQVVWRASTRIGCAWVVCPELEFGGLVLCNYSPGGNDGSRPY